MAGAIGREESHEIGIVAVALRRERFRRVRTLRSDKTHRFQAGRNDLVDVLQQLVLLVLVQRQNHQDERYSVRRRFCITSSANPRQRGRKPQQRRTMSRSQEDKHVREHVLIRHLDLLLRILALLVLLLDVRIRIHQSSEQVPPSVAPLPQIARRRSPIRQKFVHVRIKVLVARCDAVKFWNG